MKSISRRLDPIFNLPSKRIVSLFVIALLLGTINASAEEFSWRVKADDVFTIRLEQSMTAKSRVEPQERIETSDATVNLTMTIVEVADAGISAKMTVNDLALKLGTPTKDGSGQIDLDTKSDKKLKDVAETLRQELLAVKGATFEIVFLPNGKMISVTLDEATEEKFRAAPASSPLTNMFSKDGLQKMFSSTHVVFPDGDISPGHAWKTEPEATDEAGSGPPLNWSYSGIVTQNQRKLHRIACSIPKSAQSSENGSKQVRIDGQYFYDSELGFPVSGKVTSHVGIATQFRELVIYTDIDTESTMTLTKN